MTDKEVLQRYIDLVPFLGAVMGSDCEIIVHDLADLDHSLVAICNSVSGRELGNPITDLARALIQRSAHTDADYLANYMGRTKNVEFLSSTYYIKNEGRLIGLLCVNKDMTAVQEAAESYRATGQRVHRDAGQPCFCHHAHPHRRHHRPERQGPLPHDPGGEGGGGGPHERGRRADDEGRGAGDRPAAGRLRADDLPLPQQGEGTLFRERTLNTIQARVFSHTHKSPVSALPTGDSFL